MRVVWLAVVLCCAALPLALPSATACYSNDPILNYLVCDPQKFEDIENLRRAVASGAQNSLDFLSERCEEIGEETEGSSPAPDVEEVCEDPQGIVGDAGSKGIAFTFDLVDLFWALADQAPDPEVPRMPSLQAPTLPQPGPGPAPELPTDLPSIPPPSMPGTPTLPGPVALDIPPVAMPAPSLPEAGAPQGPEAPSAPAAPVPNLPGASPPPVPSLPAPPTVAPGPTSSAAPAPTHNPSSSAAPEAPVENYAETQDAKAAPAPLLPGVLQLESDQAAPGHARAAASPSRQSTSPENPPMSMGTAPKPPQASVEVVTWVIASGGGLYTLWHLLLYNRLSGSRVEKNPVRNRLLDEIRRRPASTIADLSTALGVHETTVAYHLRVLERYGHIVVHARSANRWFFENHGRYEPQARKAWSVLQRPVHRDFLAAVHETGGRRLEDIARRLDIPVSTAGYRAGVLAKAEVLVREKGTWRITAAALDVLRHDPRFSRPGSIPALPRVHVDPAPQT